MSMQTVSFFSRFARIRSYLGLAAINAVLAVLLPTLTLYQQQGDSLILQRQMLGILNNSSTGVPQFGFLIGPLLISIIWNIFCFSMMIRLVSEATRIWGAATYQPVEARKTGWMIAHLSMAMWTLASLAGGIIIGNDGSFLSIDRLSNTPLLQQYMYLNTWIAIRAVCLVVASLILIAPIIIQSSKRR